MATPRGYMSVPGSEPKIPADHKRLNPTSEDEQVKLTLILRRRKDGRAMRGLKEFSAKSIANPQVTHKNFADNHGADPGEMQRVQDFAHANGLEVVRTNPAARSVEVAGPASAINKAFAVELQDYQSPRGKYRSHTGPAALPGGIADVVEAVVGLNNRPVNAQHYATTGAAIGSGDPPNTNPLTPQQVASLYNFPAGNGTGQTIGIYEMQIGNTGAGYTKSDLSQTMQAFGGNLTVPVPIDVPVNGVTNSGVSDGETGLDITVAAAIAQGATLAVYFTGGDTQSIVNALQAMIHPQAGQPQPTILSISYGWGPDDTADSFTSAEYTQLDQLFQDAANLNITVLVSSGDSGAHIESKTEAQASYPATEPWVIACGGTTICEVQNGTFNEYVWNDVGAGGPGATGGGVSNNSLFPLPSYQANASVPAQIRTGFKGRGIPDVAGNASENAGYVQFINGQSQPVGGTSAVAPLYAGLIALINANLGRSVGFINPTLYSLPAATFSNIVGPPGPANNSYGKVKGYPATAGWNGCTGLGSVNGTALQNGLQTAVAAQPQPEPVPVSAAG
ncbi:MAG: protease pro-enzyme activation domain-containing protein [Terracidiphilus sp.]